MNELIIPLKNGNNIMETDIPFMGFYESVHDCIINNAIELAIGDDQGNYTREKFDDVILKTDFHPIHLKYAKEYLQAFSQEIEIELSFIELYSPKYYNFETDRIFAKISEENVLKMWSLVDRDELQKLIKERFTSCSGFISHYPNDLDKWPENVLEWDLNQVGTLLIVYATTVKNWDQDKELYLLDNSMNPPHEFIMEMLSL